MIRTLKLLEVQVFLMFLWPTYQLLNVKASEVHLVGHLQPLGHQRQPEVVTEELHDVPYPGEFWERYVHPNKPVLFRGAAKRSRYDTCNSMILFEDCRGSTIVVSDRPGPVDFPTGISVVNTCSMGKPDWNFSWRVTLLTELWASPK